MSTPSNVYYHAFHENPFTFPFRCVQRHMTFQMDSVNLHWDPFKSLSEVHKIHLKRLVYIESLFHFWTPENFKNYDFPKFSGGKNGTLA